MKQENVTNGALEYGNQGFIPRLGKLREALHHPLLFRNGQNQLQYHICQSHNLTTRKDKTIYD